MINILLFHVTGRNLRMEMKLTKLLPLVGALCLGFVSPTYAQNNHQSSSTYGSGNMDASSGESTYQRGTFREITPVAGPRVSHGADVFITADFIYWKTSEEGLSYAASFPTDASGNVTSGKTKSVGQSWDPGFKVGLGLNLAHDGWDLFAQYTWLRPGESNSIKLPAVAQGTILPDFAVDSAVVGFNSKATGKWDRSFNVIDLELGRNFYLSQFLTMRPFIGLKGTWQDESARFRFINVDNAAVPAGQYEVKLKNDVWGVGVRGGLNLGYYMSKSWSIYGNFAWTAMWADYSKADRTDSSTQSGATTVAFRFKNDSFYAVRYIAEAELGLRWEIWFYDDSYHFAIQAGWEEQMWLNWARLFSNSHDLNMHGLTLKFRFDF